ncbi:MAG: cell division protein ZipA [Gammaproteobacteria bacterium]|jgi:cell division protein ZipA
MGTRELLILILGLAVIAVILRGLYVAIQARRNQIRLAIDRNIPQDIDLEELEMSELPSGGARVVKRSLAEVNLQNSLQSELDLGVHGEAEETVPMLMDSVELRTKTPERRDKTAPADKDTDQAERAIAALGEEAEEDSLEQWETSGTRRVEPEQDSIDAETEEVDSRQIAAAQYEQYDQADADDDGQYDSSDWEEEPDSAAWRDEAEAEPEEPSDIFSEYDEGRQDPAMGLDEELGDEFGEFSMSAGDRIGAPESDRTAAGQPDTDNTSADPGRGGRKGSLFSRFGRKEEPSYQEQGPVDFDSADEEDMDDPLFSTQSAKSQAETESRTAESGESAASLRRAADQDTARAETAARPATVAEEPARQSPRDTAGKAGVTDFNQARESRRPASGNRRGNGHSAEASGSRNNFEPSEVLVINVMSREGEMFHGADLLQVLTTAGLKHGDMNIFHKHVGSRVDSPIVFSVANILNPGTFELDKMEQFETRGVSLFLAMPAVISNREAFDDMLRIAQQIRAALDGELRDDRRSVMTSQTIEHYRQRVQDYELRKLKAAQVQS